MPDLHARLTRPDLPAQVIRLGFRGPDVDDVLATAAQVAGSADDLARIEVLADRLTPARGSVDPWAGEDPWGVPEARSSRFGVGVLPMVTLLATADDVAEFHRASRVSAEVSKRTLSDLGQQVWVHRLTYGEFGLHTEGWLRTSWSGALYWLGRLQFHLEHEAGDRVLSTHIPRAGPLTAESVDASLAWGRTFFAEHFPGQPASAFYCSSWLLDPQLAAALPAESNMARFQRRWKLYGEPEMGDTDALFFTFARRGDVDLDQLPQDTTLQRALVARLRAGGHWRVCKGRIPMNQEVSSP